MLHRACVALNSSAQRARTNRPRSSHNKTYDNKVFTVIIIHSFCVPFILVLIHNSFTSHVLSMTNVWSIALHACSFWNINLTNGTSRVPLIMTDYPCTSVVETSMWWNTECEMSELEVWSKHMSRSASKWIFVREQSLLNCSNDDFIINCRVGGGYWKSPHVTSELMKPKFLSSVFLSGLCFVITCPHARNYYTHIWRETKLLCSPQYTPELQQMIDLQIIGHTEAYPHTQCQCIRFIIGRLHK